MASIFFVERLSSSRKAKHIKCAAGDSWSLLVPLTVFIRVVLQPLGTVGTECEAFLAMLEVIDLVTSTPRRKVAPRALLVTIEKFLRTFTDIWGFAVTRDKFGCCICQDISSTCTIYATSSTCMVGCSTASLWSESTKSASDMLKAVPTPLE